MLRRGGVLCLQGPPASSHVCLLGCSLILSRLGGVLISTLSTPPQLRLQRFSPSSSTLVSSPLVCTPESCRLWLPSWSCAPPVECPRRHCFSTLRKASDVAYAVGSGQSALLLLAGVLHGHALAPELYLGFCSCCFSQSSSLCPVSSVLMSTI